MEPNLNYITQKGFTLLELMVALALGLIISAAAIQLFLTSQRSITMQQALSNMQSDSVFGLEALIRDIRLANLNADQPY
ncbi:MAG: prepilin-type N-terminal cleavage/methylation domain-containing protein, partial [Pseudomonadota bacterium]|nr:prepilin-type N-terminal cleavage/methylation domain-containing protein [Pseudomonadota bacterium]